MLVEILRNHWWQHDSFHYLGQRLLSSFLSLLTQTRTRCPVWAWRAELIHQPSNRHLAVRGGTAQTYWGSAPYQYAGFFLQLQPWSTVTRRCLIEVPYPSSVISRRSTCAPSASRMHPKHQRSLSTGQQGLTVLEGFGSSGGKTQLQLLSQYFFTLLHKHSVLKHELYSDTGFNVKHIKETHILLL